MKVDEYGSSADLNGLFSLDYLLDPDGLHHAFEFLVHI